MQKTRARAGLEGELERNRRRVKQMVNAIADGMPALPMKDEMIALEARREEIEAELAVEVEPVPMLHPSLAIRYREELDRLHEGLTSEENRHEASRSFVALSTRLNGVEFDAGGRFIDILAVDKGGAFVVIELKVGRGYDRVIGQLLRYRSWVKQNMETDRPVRGVIIAHDISSDLKLATADIPNIELVEYEISFGLKHVQ